MGPMLTSAHCCVQDDLGVSDYCKDLLHGRGNTRWFDKSITLVVYANGKVVWRCGRG